MYRRTGREAEVRILMCSLDGPEPRTNGIRLAVASLLDELRRSHDVRHIAYRQSDQLELRDDSEIRFVELPPPSVRGASLMRATVRGRPREADRLAAGLRDALRVELEAFEPDVVHVNRWILASLGRHLAGLPTVLSAFDAWHLNVDASIVLAGALRKRLLRAEAHRIRRFEAEEFAHFGRVVVVTEHDRAALEELNPDLRVYVVPNGVDTQYFSKGEEATVVNGRIVFTGDMGYPPNIVAAEFLGKELLPRIREARADAHLVIVGRHPDARVAELARRPGIEVTGEVDDVRPWLRSAHVFVCPMLTGTGIKNKLLEAMASELPCVVTPRALQGLKVVDGREVVVGETAEELSGRVLGLMGDDARARRLGRAARDYVSAAHSWPSAARAYVRMYDEVRADRGSDRAGRRPTGGTKRVGVARANMVTRD
jgi:polysaccharide biosynthesis protein PslH